MKSIIRITLMAALLILVSVAQAATWKVDNTHSTVSFAVKYMGLSNVRGDFNEFDATVTFDESNPATFSVDATAQTASIDTRNEKRDGHLKSADFFDVENHPELKKKILEQENIVIDY